MEIYKLQTHQKLNGLSNRGAHGWDSNVAQWLVQSTKLS